jgi:hypothetical protein
MCFIITASDVNEVELFDAKRFSKSTDAYQHRTDDLTWGHSITAWKYFVLFWPPTYLHPRGYFSTWSWTILLFLTTYPPHFVHVVFELSDNRWLAQFCQFSVRKDFEEGAAADPWSRWELESELKSIQNTMGLKKLWIRMEIYMYHYEFFILHWRESPDLIGSANP